MVKSLRLLAVAATLALTASLAACDTGGAAAPGGGGDGGGGEGTINIGIKYDQPGLGMKDGDEYKGFDVDVARYVAEELGYSDINFIVTPSKQRENLHMSGLDQVILSS